MTEKETKVLDAVIALILAVPSMVWSSYVATVMWGWFIVPFGVRQIGMAWAFGLMTLIGLTRIKPNQDKPKDESPTKNILSVAFAVAFMLGIGYVAHKLMVAS